MIFEVQQTIRSMDNYPDFQIPLHSPTFSPIPLLWRRDIPTPLQRPEFPYCRGIPLRVVTLLLAQAPSLACLSNKQREFPRHFHDRRSHDIIIKFLLVHTGLSRDYYCVQRPTQSIYMTFYA